MLILMIAVFDGAGDMILMTVIDGVYG